MKPFAQYTKDDLMRLLESLTPGGSEFYESPENCARFIRDRKGKPSEKVREQLITPATGKGVGDL